MDKEKKGYIDSLLDDFTAMADMKAAIEASRDENGKIDEGKAAGIAMGMGHMSDNDIALMGAMLGAEGAFDDNKNSFDNFNYVSTPITSVNNYTVPNSNTERIMTEAEYESKKASILSEKRFIIGTAIVGLFLFTILFLYMMGAHSDGTGIYLFLLVVIDASLAYAIHNTNQAREHELTALDIEYRNSKQREAKRKESEQIHEKLKNHAGTQDIAAVVYKITQKMKYVYDSADKVCGVTEPSFHSNFVSSLLSGLFYLAVKDCDFSVGGKKYLFDFLVLESGIECKYTGKMLFPTCQPELDELLRKTVNVFLKGVVLASYISDNPDNDMDFTNTICSLMILLSDKIEQGISYAGFAKSAVPVTLKETERAVQRVIDERLLG